MAEEIKENKGSMFEKFMQAGKVAVFESGLERPDHIQDRPFFNLLPKGKTSFVNMGDSPDKLEVLSAEEQAESPYLDTEAHKFFENMEKRFRDVMPGVTLFIIDPDAVQGRYLMDEENDRSLRKSLFMYVEDKLQKAAADKNKTFLTNPEILDMVAEAGITDRNPFSMRAAIDPQLDNLAGLGNVNLVIGDNPDAMSANVLDCVLGAEERRKAEGVSYDEFRRLVLYHELGHATDHNYASARNSIEKIAENDLENVMNRHRTECIADAHAVLQLARDFGDTKCAELWGDCRIEYLRMCVNRRMQDTDFAQTKYDSEFMAKLREADAKSHALNPQDPDYENKFKALMHDKQVADTVGKLGSPLAYHTTDVIDATVAWAKQHLADGSLQKMSDLEVIKQAQVMSETYGLTRQQMSEISLALATGQKHPKYEQMMARAEESRDRMPIDRKTLDKQYELQDELAAYKAEARLAEALGLPAPKPNFSPELMKKLVKDQAKAQVTQRYAESSVANYQEKLFDTFERVGYTRDDMLAVIGEQKEALRKDGKNDAGKKDPFAAYKLKVLDAVIAQAPVTQTALTAGKRVKDQLAAVKSTTEVSGKDAIVHFVKNELKLAASVEKMLMKAYDREPAKQTMEEQIASMRSENRDFNKALIAEKETQIAAFAIRKDPEAWALVSKDPVLTALVDQKAKQKPTAVFAQYQMIAGAPDKETVAALLEGSMGIHQYVAKAVTENKELAEVFQIKAPKTMSGLKRYAAVLNKESSSKSELVLSPLGLKDFTVGAQKQDKEGKKNKILPIDLKTVAANKTR